MIIHSIITSMFAGKPVIGIAGGIGSGKSFIASLFGQMGCMVVNSISRLTMFTANHPSREMLCAWWG